MPNLYVQPTAPNGALEGDVWINSGSTYPRDVQVFQAGSFRPGGTFTGARTFEGVVTTKQGIVQNGRQAETVTGNKTLDEGDGGVVQVVTADGAVVTLPATVVGTVYIIENGGADAAVGINVSPNASDKIMGNGFTSADDKDAINTKATAKKGDYIKLVGDGANGWMVAECVGVWAREG